MAIPLTADQWLAALRAEGVTVEEYPGWRTRGRDAATGLTFGPVRMFLNHHTAGHGAKDTVAKNGVVGLPGPLAHVYLARTGVATMCSAGRANHAGKMASNAYASFRDEAKTHPAPSAASGTIDGNDVSYGVECENLGDNADIYPRAQYDAWVRINAAVCRHHGWSAESVGCHKETSVEGKIDPRGPVEGYGARGMFAFTPAQFRTDVTERLAHPATWSPTTPSPEEDDPMTLTDTDVKKVAAAVVEQLLTADRFDAPADAADYSADKTNAKHYWSGRSVFSDLVTRVRRIDRTLTALAKKLEA
ncbi:N-acetylmuramoyl-L-alanine amidase [Streptomyces sp. NPDC060198]|uniref:peptidoglycan recognition protein family protein n=1 Tax=Streptomyces sp. NPDC060198 TaxID=3347070 RepID=UPI003646DF19